MDLALAGLARKPGNIGPSCSAKPIVGKAPRAVDQNFIAAEQATAWDRDKLRQIVLEGLGWRLHRIWSTDWWHDAEGQTNKLLQMLSE